MKAMNSTVFLGVVLLGVFLGTACGSIRRGEPITGQMDRSNRKTEQGRVVFQNHCHQCHPGGEGGLAPALNDKPAPVWLMKTQVRVGLGAMPSFGEDQISPEELDNLMAYVVALRKDR